VLYEASVIFGFFSFFFFGISPRRFLFPPWRFIAILNSGRLDTPSLRSSAWTLFMLNWWFIWTFIHSLPLVQTFVLFPDTSSLLQPFCGGGLPRIGGDPMLWLKLAVQIGNVVCFIPLPLFHIFLPPRLCPGPFDGKDRNKLLLLSAGVILLGIGPHTASTVDSLLSFMRR